MRRGCVSRSRTRARRSFALLGAAAALSLGVGCGGDNSGVVALDLEGRQRDAMSFGAHDVSAFVFVSTSCPISNRYLPTLNQLGASYGEVADIIAVYPDPHDTAENIAEHQREFDVELPTLRDPEHALVRYLGVEVTPEAVVFAGRGAQARQLYRGRIDDRAPSFGTFRAQSGSDDLRDALVRAKAGDGTFTQTPAVGCPLADLR